MKHTVTIQFATAEDAAWFLAGCEKQLAKPEEQLGANTRGLMMAALQRAKAVKASMTSEEARKVRLG